MNNTVELLGWYGGDETHAASAWTSTSRHIDEEKRARIPQLLKFLAENQHETPFEKSMLHFLITCDIASHIHLIKHRVGVSVNAESARYRELKDDKYYIPDDWPKYTFLRQRIEKHIQESYDLYHWAIDELTNIWELDRKRAKESARFVLPYANQITSDVSFNWRSFIHFQRLRNDEHAQIEIQEIAQAMLEAVRDIEGSPFKYSLAAFGY